jgi:hypothetical protein
LILLAIPFLTLSFSLSTTTTTTTTSGRFWLWSIRCTSKWSWFVCIV